MLRFRPNGCQLSGSGYGLTVNFLLVAGKVHGLDTADLLAGRGGNGLDGNGGADSVGSSNEGAALDGGSGQLAGQGAESLGAVAGGHCDGLLGG